MEKPPVCDTVRSLICDLHKADALKFGDFTLKSGIQSPFYIDLRVIISYPRLLASVANTLWQVAKDNQLGCNSICGVPYTALPIATHVSTQNDIPMLIRRKEAKDYGTKKLIEGHFQPGDKCIIIEDIVTSGTSVLETVQMLRNAGLVVTDAIVFLDRQQGGTKNLEKEGITLHHVINIDDMLSVLLEEGRINQDCCRQVKDFLLACNQVSIASAVRKSLSYSSRAEQCPNPVTKRLFQLMEKKQSNLALSADVSTSSELLQMADKLGPYICILKTHIDILNDFDFKVAERLAELGKKHNFLLMEDRKFGDIGKTVQQQYQGGVYKILEWADIVTVHSISGPDVVTALKEVAVGKPRACLLVGQMSSRGNLIDDNYTSSTLKMAEQNANYVSGFISQSRLTDDPSFIHMMPGINISNSSDNLGQQYSSPDDAVRRGADVIIVGRGISAAEDSLQAAKMYQDAGWIAYKKAIATV